MNRQSKKLKFSPRSLWEFRGESDMSTIQRQIVWSVGFSFPHCYHCRRHFYHVFPLISGRNYGIRHFMDIPFVIFIPAFSIADWYSY